MTAPHRLAEAERRRASDKPAEPSDGRRLHLLQRLYDSEINFAISTMWDCGFEWKLGDPINGYPTEGRARTFDDAAAEIVDAAIQHFPHSEFARHAGPSRNGA